jgi:putative chitinase
LAAVAVQSDLSGVVARLAPQASPELRAAMADALPEYGIVGRLRLAHWIAQVGHESGSFRFVREIWRPTPQQRRYDPPTRLARVLGNVQPGDGFRYRGRGLIQLTGRFNYALFGRALDLSLVERPELAEGAQASARIACEYWAQRRLNALADRDDLRGVTRQINGGFNGFQDRARRLTIAKAALRQAGYGRAQNAGM